MSAQRKVKMLTVMAGEGFVRNVGDEIDVSEAEAGRLVKKGFAKLVDEPAPGGEGTKAEKRNPK